jgi:hypothetical protein
VQGDVAQKSQLSAARIKIYTAGSVSKKKSPHNDPDTA